MGSTWVPDYPEAREKRDQYDRIIDDLSAYVTIVEDAEKRDVISINKILDSSGVLTGVYYDEYIEDATDWRKKVKSYDSDIMDVRIHLNRRINNAKIQKELWVNRMSMGHYEEDESEETGL